MGKQYEPILTTRDGLWRYQIGDVLTILGFSAQSNAPIFKFAGRKSSVYYRSYRYTSSLMTGLGQVEDPPPTRTDYGS